MMCYVFFDVLFFYPKFYEEILKEIGKGEMAREYTVLHLEAKSDEFDTFLSPSIQILREMPKNKTKIPLFLSTTLSSSYCY